jgi:hypothetical protein
MIEVVVSRLGIDPSNQSYVVVLQEKGGSRLLPIWIGKAEAESIVTQLHHMKPARPLTHDLCKGVIAALGARLRRIQITRVENNTYYGELHLERGGTVVQVDSRPSDAIAVAVRLDAPIFAAENLLMEPAEDADSDDEGEAAGAPQPNVDAFELSAEQLKEYLEHLRPEDFGKFSL